MTEVGNSESNSNSADPYTRLGLERGASFEQVQLAREKFLSTAGTDPKAKALIEKAYDAVLMERLRDRQNGEISTEAANASQQDKIKINFENNKSNPILIFSKVKSAMSNFISSNGFLTSLIPKYSVVDGSGLLVRLVSGLSALLILFISVNSSQLILSLALIGCYVSFIKRGRKALSSLLLSIIILIFGLLIGALLYQIYPSSFQTELPIVLARIQTYIATIFLWLASLLLF